MSEAMALGDAVPRGVKLRVAGDDVVLKVRAGTVQWGSVFATLLAGGWTFGWSMFLMSAIGDLRDGTLDNPAPTFVVSGVMVAIGLYCALLCLWTMLGSERLVIRNGRLMLGSPWLFGMLNRSYDLKRVQTFSCLKKDCGLEGDSCCCSITNIDYPLSFGNDGHRVLVFSQAPNAAKDWIRDQLNVVLKDRGTDAPKHEHKHDCACGHHHH